MSNKKRKKRPQVINPLDNMSAKDRNTLKGMLRKAFSRSALRKAVIAGSKVRRPLPRFKNGRENSTVRVRCAECTFLYPEYMIEVDHIEEVGTFYGDWGYYIKRIWCDIENLQCLCKWCHEIKTRQYNQEQERLLSAL